LLPRRSLNVLAAHRQSASDLAPSAKVWLVAGQARHCTGESSAARKESAGHSVHTPVAPTIVPK
jgi:hypothetical protein